MPAGRRGLVWGLILLGLLVVLAAAGPMIVGYDPLAIDAGQVLAPPSLEHPLGADSLGRDVAARLFLGARRSLAAGAVATLVALTLGAGLGALSGVARPALDALLARIADIVNSFPLLVGALALLGLAGPYASTTPFWLRAGLVLGAFAWPGLYRLVRAEVQRLRDGELAAAARAVGATPLRVALRHLLPLVLPPALTQAAFLAGSAVLAEVGLGFLGLGSPPPAPTWGGIMLEGMSHLHTAWWLTVFPGLCLFATVLACQLIGEGLVEDR